MDGGLGLRRSEPSWRVSLRSPEQPKKKLPLNALPSNTEGSGQIVAIVDAYDNPNVASDLAQYRSNFGLGTANFTKYNQQGQTSSYPQGNHNWGVEIDLDVEMASAVCPKCTIYLIEANSSNSKDLDTAEAEAVTLGAHISAVASGVAEYDTYGYGGWFTVGGTSVATPLMAGGNASSQNAAQKFWKLKKQTRKKELHYISSGNDGACGGSYLCQAGTNQFGTYSGPGGWGSPNGTGAF